NISTVWNQAAMGQALLNSTIVAGLVSLSTVLFSTLAGFAFAKLPFRGRNILLTLVVATMTIPPQLSVIPLYQIITDLEWGNQLQSVILPSLVAAFGVFFMRQFLAEALPVELIEAARVDGAREFRLFRSVALPMMVPGLVTVFLFQFVAIWNNFLLPYIMLGDDSKFPVTVGLYSLLQQGANAPALYTLVITGALLSIVPLIALFLGLQRYWRIDLLSGAVKS
ncbi:carbohydrate ABC transporter permease, partial [Kitasatospora nipponensis]|uniref:carbohydrate ABC transporter permease n=1 Tax=Kitasatospora nipponensis TaxID=258049 RepID=UPI0031E09DE1